MNTSNNHESHLGNRMDKTVCAAETDQRLCVVCFKPAAVRVSIGRLSPISLCAGCAKGASKSINARLKSK